MEEQTILTERRTGYHMITLNRPRRLNAFCEPMHHALRQAIGEAESDGACRALLLTGAGRAFCAGQDLNERISKDGEVKVLGSALESHYNPLIRKLRALPFPVIAAVNGPAAGGGMNLALACDMRIASDQAKFAESFAKLGLYPDFGGTYFLPRIVGMALAAELFYTAETLSADDALRLGIVNRVFPASEFENEVRKLSEELASAPPMAFRDVKRTILGDDRRLLEEKLDEEIRLQIHCFESEDCNEGLNAFFEKRKPAFRGF